MDNQKTAPLRRDIDVLGRTLGRVLVEQSGPALLEEVERVRKLAKESRKGRKRATDRLEKWLTSLPVDKMVDISRAFSIFLNLANVAEQHHRIRRRNYYKLHSKVPQKGSFESTFPFLKKKGVTGAQLFEAITQMKIDLIFTAHPTEITRRTLVEKYNRVEDYLRQLDSPLSEMEQSTVFEGIHREITAIWLTSEIRKFKPTPIDEARLGITVVEKSLWKVLPQFLRHLDRVLTEETGKSLPLTSTPVTFGSWMGGDRDGNPFVTADLTEQVHWLTRKRAAQFYRVEIEELISELSMSDCTEELKKASHGHRDPYRGVLHDLREKLIGTIDFVDERNEGKSKPQTEVMIRKEKELLEPLMLCYRSLCATKASAIANGRLLDLIRRVQIFGISLFKMDLRQDSSVHSQLIAEVCEAQGGRNYAEWSEEKKTAYLLDELKKRETGWPEGIRSEASKELQATFDAAARIGPEGLNIYIISMTRAPSDILTAELLKRWAGIRDYLPVVPLFETVDDLRHCRATMETLMKLPAYRKILGGKLTIMLGYSDSTKSGGRLAAAWELHQAQITLAQLAKKNSLELTLFHGRGGSVGRGGGPVYHAIAAQPDGTVQGRLRVTEQGEMIQAKFGLPGIALRTLDLYLTATLRATVLHENKVRPAWSERMDQLAEDSRKHFVSTIFESGPDFEKYFYQLTPIRELRNLNIGSRPAKRKKVDNIASLRAIPWIFSWTQTRFLVSSWFGVGYALHRAIAEGHLPELQKMYRDWAFFRSTIELLEMVLAKADLKIADRYERELVEKGLLPVGVMLREEFSRAKKSILKIVERKHLLENNAVIVRSIEVRNPYVDPLNVVQVELIRRLRQDDSNSKCLDALLVTINGVAAGMRNTG